MIDDLGYCNNTDSWPVWYIFQSTCSFNVSCTIKQSPFTAKSFSVSPVARRGFLSLTLEHLLPTNNSPHVFCVMLNIPICLQDVQLNLSSNPLLHLMNPSMVDFANMLPSRPSPVLFNHSFFFNCKKREKM